MNFKSFTKIAAVSAIALMGSLHAAGVVAAPYVIGTDLTIPFSATVDNTIDVVVTAGNFGTLAAMNSNAVGDVATAVLPAAAGPIDLVDDHSTGYGTATQAHIVGSNGTAAGASVVVTSAFFNEAMYVTFTGCTDLVNGAGPEFPLSSITTSMGGAPYDCTTPMATGQTFTTDAAGAYTFYVGGTITTDGTTDVAYPGGVYNGSVTMQITY